MGRSSEAVDAQEDPEGPGHVPPCAPVELLRARVASVEVDLGTQRANLHQTQQQVGEMLIGIGEAASHSREAHREACAAKRAAERVAAQVLDPINKMLAKYQHDSNPPLDYGEDAGDFTKSQPIPEIVRRAKMAEKENERLAAESARVALAAKLEADRLAKDAAVEKERVEKAAKLELERLAREKERDRLLHAAIGAIVAISTALTTYFAARGH